MLFCQVAWLYALLSIGVAVRAFKLTASKDVVTVNVRQNVTLRWSYEIAAGESYDIWWGTSHGGTTIKDVLFRKSASQAVAQPSSAMPAKYVGRVKIVSQASLFIRRVDLSDEGFYVCQINGDFITLRKKINLTVIDPPRIVTEIAQAEPWREGNSEELTCDSVGKPKPTVTWKKDGNILTQGRRIAKLEFSPVTYKDEGLYTCIAENVGGQEEKQVQINVHYKPKDTNITTDTRDDTVSDGSLIRIVCKARGNPAPKYRFFIDGKPIGDRKAERSGILMITAIKNSQSGIYSCQPENKWGRGPVSEVTVYVRHAPTITLRPSNKIADENTPVTVRCEARGYPPPTIKWIKLLGNRNVGNGSSLLLPNVQRSDKGRYRCIAANSVGYDTAEFNINVYYAPVINKTASSQDVPAWAGITTNLTCVADGDPAPRYIWTNSSGVVATSEKSGILQVTPQGLKGFGPYTCTVTNSKGQAQLDVRLVKVDKPVVKLSIQTRHKDSLSLSWSLLSEGTSHLYLLRYTLQYRTADSNRWIRISGIPPRTTSYTLTNLTSYTEYIIELYATNKHFTSDPSRETAMTVEAKPSPPQNVEANAINSTAVLVKWKAPLYPNGPLKLYTILYEKSQYFGTDDPRMESVKPNVTEKTIGGLSPFTNYTVKVKVLNVLTGTESKAVIVVTMSAAPSEPKSLEANTTGAYSVRLRWKKPSDVNGIVVAFKVRMLWRFTNVKGDYKHTIREIPAKVTTRAGRRRFRRDVSDYSVLRLEPYREIELKRVQPFATILICISEGTRDSDKNMMWSPFSNNQTIETMEGAPSAPRSVELKDKEATSLKVTWIPPEFPNGIIQKYRIIYSNNTEKNYTVDVTKGLKNASLFYILSGLNKDRSYQIYVQAFTSFPGEVSPPVSRDITKTPVGALEHSGMDAGSLYGGVFAGIIILAFVIIIVALIIRKHRKQRDSTELNGKRYAVANSNDSGIGDKESLDRVPGVRYVQGVRRGSEGSESWV